MRSTTRTDLHSTGTLEMKKLSFFCLLAAIQITASMRSGSAVETVPADHQRDKKDATTASRLQASGNDAIDAATIIILTKGDVFEGDEDILEKAHKPAKLRLYLNKVKSLDSGENSIEANAEMTQYSGGLRPARSVGAKLQADLPAGSSRANQSYRYHSKIGTMNLIGRFS